MDSTSTSLGAFFQQITPGLTFYSILLTLAILSFQVAKFFWNYEKTLKEENISRLKSLLSSYSQRHIYPIFKSQLSNALEEGYKSALSELLTDIYVDQQNQSGVNERVLIEQVELSQMLSFDAMLSRSPDANAVNIYSSTSTGIELSDKIDSVYEKRSLLISCYQKAYEAAARACYSAFSISVLMTIGLLRLLADWGTYLTCLWVFLTGLAVFHGLYAFIRMEIFRRRLLRSWERMELYGGD